MPASNGPPSFARYLAAWNEPDVTKIRAHLDGSVAPGVVFADPANHTVGVDELEAMIREARIGIPTAEYVQTSGIDGGHDRRYRYSWEVRVDGATFAVGMDCTTVDAEGRIERLDGFFGDFPPLPD
jgi:SnoaL-like domain